MPPALRRPAGAPRRPAAGPTKSKPAGAPTRTSLPKAVKRPAAAEATVKRRPASLSLSKPASQVKKKPAKAVAATSDAGSWSTIDKAFKALYPNQEEQHYGTIIKYSVGGPDPIDGTSIFANVDGGYWHYVSFGMTELYEKEHDDFDVSGCGYEFTMKVKFPADCDPHPSKAPMWPINLMNNLARYTLESGNALNVHDTMPLNSPICMDAPHTKLDCVAFVEDPSFSGEQASPTGSFFFLLIVGITTEEELIPYSWTSAGMLSLLKEHAPTAGRELVTDLDRSSITDLDVVRQRALEGMEAEGSTRRMLFADPIAKDGSTIRLGAVAVTRMVPVIQSCLLHNYRVTLCCSKFALGIQPTESPSATSSYNEAESTLTLNSTDGENVLSFLKKGTAGVHQIESTGITLEIHKQEIRDHEGNVVRVVG